MKRLICMLLFLLLACMLATCVLAADFYASDFTASGSWQQLGKAKDFGSAKIRASVPDENLVIEGESPLTGEPFDGNWRLVLANIDTHPRALPHWGVASADITYELPIQADGSTRSLALFMTEHPDSAGPIRSARVPMASLREMWGGTYCFYGYQGGRDKNNVKEWAIANSAAKRFAYPYYLNGMTKNSKWFPRSSDHSHVAPYNVRLDIGAVLADGTAEANLHPFRFTDEPLSRGKTFIQIVDNEQPVVVLADQQIAGSVEPQQQRLTVGTGSAKSAKPRTTRTPKPTRAPNPTATPEPTEPEQTEFEQTKPEQVEPEQAEPEQVEPEQNELEQTEPEQTEPEQAEAAIESE